MPSRPSAPRSPRWPILGATDSAVGGEAPALYDISAVSNSDLVKVIPIAIVVIGILLALVLRSLVAPVYLIASVGLSYLAALGLSVLLFVNIGGSQGLVFFLPFLMFIFLLALGEDYNILVMTRIREEAHKLPLREAVVKAIGLTGTTVTSAGLVLAGTFVVFGIVAGGGSGGSQFRDIALGLALGILMDTFLVRTLLVPSTVVLLGRWNWWPSKLTMDRPEVPCACGGVWGGRGRVGRAGVRAYDAAIIALNSVRRLRRSAGWAARRNLTGGVIPPRRFREPCPSPGSGGSRPAMTAPRAVPHAGWGGHWRWRARSGRRCGGARQGRSTGRR